MKITFPSSLQVFIKHCNAIESDLSHRSLRSGEKFYKRAVQLQAFCLSGKLTDTLRLVIVDNKQQKC